MKTGMRSSYRVIEWDNGDDADLTNIIQPCPRAVLGNFVAIATCDSGPYTPTAAELAEGWLFVGNLAISPRVTAISQLPAPHFDEWYVYDRNTDLGLHRAFVNHAGFAPLNDRDPLTEEFWAQVARLNPKHVLGAGAPTLFLVTRDEEVYRAACRVIEASFE
jgi:hypothetical protein